MMDIKPGQYLYASCSAMYYGPILRVGKDANDFDVIDLQVDDINAFISCERWPEEVPGLGSLMRVETNGPVVFRELQYRLKVYPFGTFIECNTPGNGCYRCTQSFMICCHECRG